jgi:hypothetical protein
MGMQTASVQSSQTSQPSGKMAAPVQPAQDIAPADQPQYRQGKGASGQAFTYSPTSGQPQMGSPNQYANTIGQWDNASIQQPVQRIGKGKG